MKFLPDLVFAPPCDVLNLFAAVVQNLPMSIAEGLVLYFERPYVGRKLGQRIVEVKQIKHLAGERPLKRKTSQ